MKSSIKKCCHLFWLFVFVILFGIGFQALTQQQVDEFSFIVTADMREYAGPEYQTLDYFFGACEAILDVGKGDFMVSPGDIDPPWFVSETLSKVFGVDYIWYPVVGNHESETKEDMAYLREYNAGGNKLPYIVNVGPEGSEETMYSFDYGNAHFIVLNQYYDGNSDIGTDGDIVDSTYHWLAQDLKNTRKKYIFVAGHEPAYPLPDMDSNRLRHYGDSLDKYPKNRDRFWKLLKEKGVLAYFCGHTHNVSIRKIEGIYQIDAGHCRGIADKGAQSSFVKINVIKNECQYEIYRMDIEKRIYIQRSFGIFE